MPATSKRRSRKNRPQWADIERQIAAGAVPPIYVDRRGNVCLDDGDTGPCLPARLVSLLPPEAIGEAKAAAERRAEERRERAAAYAESERRRQAELHARGEGFVLMAGEDSAVIHRGTYAECLSSRWLALREPRDPYSGKGCWLILGPDAQVVASGEYDAHMYW